MAIQGDGMATKPEALRRGDVIRYRFLWRKEAAAGLEAVVARPCLVVDAKPAGDRQEVLVVPFTHEPQHDSRWLTVPEAIRREAGLEAAASYVVVSEANRFLYPSWDVMPVKDRAYDKVVRGRLAHGFAAGVKRGFDAAVAEKKLALVDRERLAREAVAQWRQAKARDR